MHLTKPTRAAIRHTGHCLIGCGLGETVGSAIGSILHWANAWQTLLAVLLAFVFGYGLTYYGGRTTGLTHVQARKLAFRTDTISIISMEIIDNILEYLIPGAMNASVVSWLFWWSMALSLGVAFVCTVPVNRWAIVQFGIGHKH